MMESLRDSANAAAKAKVALLEAPVRSCYASNEFMLWTTVKKFLDNDGKWIFESIFAVLKNKLEAKAT
jgi:hypothetical protein